MSGPENLRGIDYQISCSVLLILRHLAANASTLASVQIESLDDEAEDLVFRFQDGRSLQIQLKKLAEGYNWTVVSLRPLLSRFSRMDRNVEFLFISDGSAARQILPLKRFFEGEGELTDEAMCSICDDNFSRADLQSLRGRVRIQTRYYPSPDESDPARHVTNEIHSILMRGPFSLERDAIETGSRLWQTLYEAGRSALALSEKELLSRFANAGLRLAQEEWAIYPIARHFYEHSEPVAIVRYVLEVGGVVLIFGMGGGGKTTFAAEAASLAAAAGRRTCWLRVSEFFEPAEILRVLAEYCTVIGLPLAAESLRLAEPIQFPSITAAVFHKFPVSVVLDRFEAASPRLAAFIREVLAALPSSESLGAVVFTSRHVPEWWRDIELERPGALSVSLAGLPDDSAVAMLRDLDVCESDGERRQLVVALGGHAQSLSLLRQIPGAPSSEVLHRDGIQVARDWLLRRVLDELPEREKETIARLSIFDYAAPVDIVEIVLDNLGPDTLRALQRRDLIRVDMGTVTVHDAIRSAALDLLSQRAVEACHRSVANYIFTEIVRDFEKDGNVLYDKSIRWAVHLESSGDVVDLGGRFSFILGADPFILRALFGISCLGFPFEFDDPSLEATIDLIEYLEGEGLIEENPANAEREILEQPGFLLLDFTFYENLLIRSLCLHHGYAGHLGYMDEMRPSFTFVQQGLVCPWEHCIELSPLPMMTRTEWEARLEEDRRRLADPEAHKLTEKHVEVIRTRLAEGVPDWAPEEEDEELRARSCPIFGHACPGGQAQAETCRAKDGFAWANDPKGPSV